MRHARTLLASIALLLAAGPAPAHAQDGEWASYRDAYRAMVVFEKYGGPKHLLQNQLQVLPKERATLGDGAALTVSGKTVQMHLPLDPLGRTPLPLQKTAYDENATLVLNRKGTRFTLRPQVAIAARPDGIYDSADLRSACGQALGFARWVDAAQRGRQCAGVRFVFQKKGESGARLRREDGADQVLPVVAGEDGLPGVSYRFGTGTGTGTGAERGQVVTNSVPLAILPLFE